MLLSPGMGQALANRLRTAYPHVGWEPDQVRQIRKRYVDRERIARGIIARMEKAASDSALARDGSGDGALQEGLPPASETAS